MHSVRRGQVRHYVRRVERGGGVLALSRGLLRASPAPQHARRRLWLVRRLQGAQHVHRCPAGNFQTNRGASACVVASAGRYAGTGAAVALPCPAGTQASLPGSVDVQACGHVRRAP